LFEAPPLLDASKIFADPSPQVNPNSGLNNSLSTASTIVSSAPLPPLQMQNIQLVAPPSHLLAAPPPPMEQNQPSSISLEAVNAMIMNLLPTLGNDPQGLAQLMQMFPNTDLLSFILTNQQQAPPPFPPLPTPAAIPILSAPSPSMPAIPNISLNPNDPIFQMLGMTNADVNKFLNAHNPVDPSRLAMPNAPLPLTSAPANDFQGGSSSLEMFKEQLAMTLAQSEKQTRELVKGACLFIYLFRLISYLIDFRE